MSDIPVVSRPSGGSPVELDAMLGYSLKGAPRPAIAELIEGINERDAHVLSLDTPSGLDTSTGMTPGAAVRADATMTLAMPKTGLRSHTAVGDLYLANISVPNAVYTDLGFDVTSPFGESPIVRIN